MAPDEKDPVNPKQTSCVCAIGIRPRVSSVRRTMLVVIERNLRVPAAAREPIALVRSERLHLLWMRLSKRRNRDDQWLACISQLAAVPDARALSRLRAGVAAPS